MTLDELEASLASPVIATPPALLRPNVGAAAREAASSRGRGLLQRNSASGSFVSSRWVTVLYCTVLDWTGLTFAWCHLLSVPTCKLPSFPSYFTLKRQKKESQRKKFPQEETEICVCGELATRYGDAVWLCLVRIYQHVERFPAFPLLPPFIEQPSQISSLGSFSSLSPHTSISHTNRF